MIVTLAGHVDHGKTTLVRGLTGTDTDRLAEEKRRGLTIDLGFAYLSDGGRTVGFVDVPGHHRFIHNMVAGVAERQHALLVVAADDGPMPQSREHLQILTLLGITAGTVALTKCDRVPAERVAQAADEVAALVAGSFLEEAPIIATAATADGDPGVTRLRARLLEGAAAAAAQSSQRPFRMAVDRAFQIKGAGLIVTGTVHDGEVAVGDELHVFPAGAAGRVRGLHVQNQNAQRAMAGDRAAVNLAGVDSNDLGRGHWLVAAPANGHRTVVLDMDVLGDFPRPVRHWTPVHVYHATSHATARLALLQGSRLQPGERGWAQLELDVPLLAKRGDRLVIRDHGLDRTLGGGPVIDNRPGHTRRRAPARLRAIEAGTAPDPGAALDALAAQGPVELEAFQALWHLSPAQLEQALKGRPLSLHQGKLVSHRQWQDWANALLRECRRRHDDDPALAGLRENDFEAGVPEEFRAEALTDLVARGELEQRAGRYRPARHRAALADAERDLLERLAPLLEQAQPPSLGDIGRSLGIPLAVLQKATRGLAAKGVVVLINDKRVYLPGRVASLADTAVILSRDGPFTARDYRDAAGIGRNVAIDVLEFFDARGYTRRSGDARTVVGDRSRVLPG